MLQIPELIASRMDAECSGSEGGPGPGEGAWPTSRPGEDVTPIRADHFPPATTEEVSVFTLLFVSNFPSNAGYAWDRIERTFAEIADRIARDGVRTLVAYPEMEAPPLPLEGSPARAIEADCSLRSGSTVRNLVRVVRREGVRVLYFTDRPPYHWAYLVARLAGARKIIVHTRTSGARTRPRGLRRLIKWLLNRVPGLGADVVVAVSDYVARREREIALVPPSRVLRVWNGRPVVRPACDGAARRALGLPSDRTIVVCACRAAAEKGVDVLLRAFDQAVKDLSSRVPRPVLLYLGDGPALSELRSIRDGLSARDDVVVAGFQRDAARLVRAADLVVVPSVWQDAFPNAVLEAMAAARPVIATRVGGIPEMIEHGRTGWLVEPGDESELAAALRRLLEDPALAGRLGARAQARVETDFTPEEQVSRLAALIHGSGSG